MGADTVIIGAGVIGCAVAYELARAGVERIVVFDSGTAGGEASNAAAGVLAVASSRAPRGVVFDLRRTSATLYPAWVAGLERESGIDVRYRTHGLLELAFSPIEAEHLHALVQRRREQGLQAEEVEVSRAIGLEPAISRDVVHA